MLDDSMPPKDLSTIPELGMPDKTPVGPFGASENLPVSGESLKMRMLYEIVVGIVVVLFLGFAGMFVATTAMLVDSWKSDKATQEDLRDKILEQNFKIDRLIKEMENKDAYKALIRRNS
jgi:hypothetical protein